MSARSTRRLGVLALLAVVALVFAVPATGASRSAVGRAATRLAERALGLSTRADQRSKRALLLARLARRVGPGPEGPRGLTGHRGPTGRAGAAGAQGLRGETGAAGPQGLRGETGETGETGVEGPQGDTGPEGPRGDAGDAGPQGPQGDGGETGPQGPAGPTGPQGPAGADATKLWAAINSGGNATGESGVSSSTRTATGDYTVVFEQNVSACAYLASAVATGTVGMANVAQSSSDPAAVVVRTYTGGVAANRAFYLAVLC